MPALFIDEEERLPVKGLPGLLTVLHDGRFDDRECIAWLFLDQSPARAPDRRAAREPWLRGQASRPGDGLLEPPPTRTPRSTGRGLPPLAGGSVRPRGAGPPARSRWWWWWRWPWGSGCWPGATPAARPSVGAARRPARTGPRRAARSRPRTRPRAWPTCARRRPAAGRHRPARRRRHRGAAARGRPASVVRQRRRAPAGPAPAGYYTEYVRPGRASCSSRVPAGSGTGRATPRARRTSASAP